MNPQRGVDYFTVVGRLVDAIKELNKCKLQHDAHSASAEYSSASQGHPNQLGYSLILPEAQAFRNNIDQVMRDSQWTSAYGHTDVVVAYWPYMEGSAHANKRSLEGVRQVINNFRNKYPIFLS